MADVMPPRMHAQAEPAGAQVRFAKERSAS